MIRDAALELLQRQGRGLQQLALRSVPDVPLTVMHRLGHAALLAQGADSWTSQLAGHRVHRYAFRGRGSGAPIVLLHGLGGSAGSMAPLVSGLVDLAPRIVLLELPGHGRSPQAAGGPLSAREYGAIAVACAEELRREHGGARVSLVGNSLGGALALFVAHERGELVKGVVGLNPAGAEISEEAMRLLPRRFPNPGAGAAAMARLLFHKAPLLFWLVARDFARGWETPTVQRILDDARAGSARSLGTDVLTNIRAPVLILWGEEDRLLPLSSADDFRRNIPGAVVELIPGCGHVPQVERAAFTRRRVHQFFSSLTE